MLLELPVSSNTLYARSFSYALFCVTRHDDALCGTVAILNNVVVVKSNLFFTLLLKLLDLDACSFSNLVLRSNDICQGSASELSDELSTAMPPFLSPF